MSEFIQFKKAVQRQLDQMVSSGNVYYVAGDKDTLWDTYLNSFPEGTNPIFRERTEHDCNCCKQFIRNIGLVVTIQEGKLVSVWDIKVGNFFDEVATELSKYVKSFPIENRYFHFEKNVGIDHNHGKHEGQIERWEHLHFKLPSTLVLKDSGSKLSELRTNKEMLQRAMETLSDDAIETVLDLINDKAIYRGEEHRNTVLTLARTKEEYGTIPSDQLDNWYWEKSSELAYVSRFRNSVIGTLIVDLSEGMELEKAVKSFETKVAPQNYKRSSALITKGMIQEAEKKVVELGLETALHRRYAILDDITVNNVLYADRSFKEAKGIFDTLREKVSDAVPDMDHIQDISIDEFLSSVMPTASSIEVMLDNAHKGNLMSLIAPCDPEAKNILKWNNNFSWSYNGEVTDSMKDRVKAHGGKVDGVLRFSIQWNDHSNDGEVDLDAHCYGPKKQHIYYGNKYSPSSKGQLDVDIRRPKENVAVENITWPDLQKMPKGDYAFKVHNFSGNHSSDGFSAEIEFNGEIHSFSYQHSIKQGNFIDVATVHFDGENFTISPMLPSNKSVQSIWGINTQKFHKVTSIMLSPNHWDGQNQGNKHWFFMLDGCINPDTTRGFYNEFLSSDLVPHRKVFEHLSSQLKAPKSDDQLSGLGFSSTKTASLIARVTGSKNSVYKINF